MNKMPMIYIAGPISKGPYWVNVRNGIDAMKLLNDNGFIPFCPMLDFLYAITFPETSWQMYLDYDFQVILRCDAVYRIPGESKGADAEEVFAGQNNIPVFKNLQDLLTWKDTVYGKKEHKCCGRFGD